MQQAVSVDKWNTILIAVSDTTKTKLQTCYNCCIEYATDNTKTAQFFCPILST